MLKHPQPSELILFRLGSLSESFADPGASVRGEEGQYLRSPGGASALSAHSGWQPSQEASSGTNWCVHMLHDQQCEFLMPVKLATLTAYLVLSQGVAKLQQRFLRCGWISSNGPRHSKLRLSIDGIERHGQKGGRCDVRVQSDGLAHKWQRRVGKLIQQLGRGGRVGG